MDSVLDYVFEALVVLPFQSLCPQGALWYLFTHFHVDRHLPCLLPCHFLFVGENNESMWWRVLPDIFMAHFSVPVLDNALESGGFLLMSADQQLVRLRFLLAGVLVLTCFLTMI